MLEGIESIGHCQFCDCNCLKSVQVPKSVNSVGDDAFANCYALRVITIPDSAKAIVYRAFTKSELASMKIPRSVVSFVGDPFVYFWNLEELDVSENPNFVFVDGVLFKEIAKLFTATPQSRAFSTSRHREHHLRRCISWVLFY